MTRTFLGWLAVGLTACVWTACVGDDSGLPPDSGGDVAVADSGSSESSLSSLTANPTSLTVMRGASASTTLTLGGAAVANGATFTVTGAPTGVTATAPAIASGQTTSTLQVQATASATEGSSTLTVSAPGLSDLKIPLLVGGAPGTLDESWDNDGLLIDTASANGVFFALTVQSDGSVVAVGGTAASGGKWLVRRFDPTGKPDTAFDAAVASAIPQGGAAHAVQIDPTSTKLVIVGDNGAATDQMAVVRLNQDGSADQAFANAGTFTATNVDFPQGSSAGGVVVRSDSSIVLAGNTTTTATPPFVFALDSTGAADASFVRYTAPNKGALTAIAELSTGALLAVGTDSSGSPPAAVVVRLTANGSPDLSFGGSGVRTYASPTSGNGFSLTSTGDGLVVGTDITQADSFAELRFGASSSGGQLWSKTFGGGNNARLRGAAPGPNDATYAAGWYSASMDSYAIVERRLPTGSLDPAFGDAGGTLTFEDPGTPDTYAYQFYCATTSKDGRLLVGGSRSIGGTGAVVIRIWP
ncbi:MAG TPA: hypothetical protein VGH28_15860 [Polyangiaceae bacterium]|jgi:uncharacterized delta-60 repeat protein